MPADLPPDISGEIHPDRLANERAYWAARDGLLAEFGGLWVGYANSRVVASGRSPAAVLAAAEAQVAAGLDGARDGAGPLGRPPEQASHGMPGWQMLWRGWRRLMDMVQGANLRSDTCGGT